MNDKTFISRWSRLKSERTAQAQTPEDTPDKPKIVPLTTTDITSGISATDLPASDLSPSEISETTSAFPQALPDEQSSEQTSETDKLSSENDQALLETTPLTDEDMPPLESLSEKSDFSQFLSSGVSDELRNLALRKLFNLPQFNVRDGLNDYDEDFSKIPVLAQEVAAKMRSWLHEKQDELTSELKEELNEALNAEANEALTEEPAQTLTEKPSINANKATDVTEQLRDTDIEHFIETNDELGDADLHG